ncbi:MAG: hypothetical protein ABI806_12760 [Candidatus Solibacter sp.]
MLVSTEGGANFTDLGIVLSTGDPLNCDAENGFFAGVNGDFYVILDRERRFFYFLFDNYSGRANVRAWRWRACRLRIARSPPAFVSRYYVGAWTEPGIGGIVSPIFPVAVS